MSIEKSTRKGKKYMIRWNNKLIHFGSKGMSDYTIHKDPIRKKRYLNRHRPRENWNDPKTAGFWSRWILWNKPTSIQDNFKSIKKKLNRLK